MLSEQVPPDAARHWYEHPQIPESGGAGPLVAPRMLYFWQRPWLGKALAWLFFGMVACSLAGMGMVQAYGASGVNLGVLLAALLAVWGLYRLERRYSVASFTMDGGHLAFEGLARVGLRTVRLRRHMSLADLAVDAGQHSLRVRSSGHDDLVVPLKWSPGQIATFCVETEQKAVEERARIRGLLTSTLELSDVSANGPSEQGFRGIRDGFAVVLQPDPDRVGWRLEVAHGAPFTGTLQVVAGRDQAGDVPLGDPILDSATTVRTTNPEGARALLQRDGVRECLMVFLHEHGDAEMDETNLSVYVPRLDPKRLAAAVSDAVALALAMRGDLASPSAVEAQTGREDVRKHRPPIPIR